MFRVSASIFVELVCIIAAGSSIDIVRRVSVEQIGFVHGSGASVSLTESARDCVTNTRVGAGGFRNSNGKLAGSNAPSAGL